MINSRQLIPLVLILALGACASSPTQAPQAVPAVPAVPAVKGPSIQLGGDDDEQATRALLKFFIQHGYSAEAMHEDTLIMHHGKGHFLLQPKLTKESIDRLLVTKAYTISAPYRGGFEALSLVITMGRRFNIGQFSLSDDGETLYIQSFYTFDNELNGLALEKFLNWMDEGIDMMILAMPELAEFIE